MLYWFNRLERRLDHSRTHQTNIRIEIRDCVRDGICNDRSDGIGDSG